MEFRRADEGASRETAEFLPGGREDLSGGGREATGGAAVERPAKTRLVGTAGHLSVFAWVVFLAVAAPPGRMDVLGTLCLGVLLIGYPNVIRRLFLPGGRMRLWLPALLASIALFPVLLFSLGWVDGELAARGLRGAVVAGLRIAGRALVLVLAVEAVTSSVDIAQIAGILEKIGFRGLGFSLGVAANLLPSLHRSWVCARESLWMRGGFRAQRWRALKLLFLTVVGSTLGRSREIAVAAECRAYDPKRSRPAPVQKGRLDRWLVVAFGASVACVLLFG